LDRSAVEQEREGKEVTRIRFLDLFGTGGLTETPRPLGYGPVAYLRGALGDGPKDFLAP